MGTLLGPKYIPYSYMAPLGCIGTVWTEPLPHVSSEVLLAPRSYELLLIPPTEKLHIAPNTLNL